MDNIEIEKLYKATFDTVLGKKCLEHLEKVFCDRQMYKKGLSLEEVAYRQGQADLVNQIIKEVRNGR